MTCVIVTDIIALAGRANEGTGSAAQASLRKSCPLIGVEQFHQLVSAEGICRQIFQRQLFQNCLCLCLGFFRSIVCGIFQHRQGCQQRLTLFGVRLHQNSIVCHPAADIAGRLCRINAEYRTETGFAGLGAGHCHNYAMLPAVLIEGIYRLRQIYAVQDLKACRIAGTNAEDHEIFALGPDVIHFDLLAVYLKVDHIFYLREEKVLCAANCIDSLRRILCLRCPYGVLCTALFIGAVSNRQIEFLCFCDGSEQSVQIFSRYFFHYLLPPL